MHTHTHTHTINVGQTTYSFGTDEGYRCEQCVYKNFCLVHKLVDVDALNSVWFQPDRGRPTESAKDLKDGVFAKQMCILCHT